MRVRGCGFGRKVHSTINLGRSEGDHMSGEPKIAGSQPVLEGMP